jgi:hypothetical protein
MASPVTAGLCALIATAFWPLIGYALARHLVPRVLALGAAGVIGWAVHSTVTLPIYRLVGFSPIEVVAVGAISILVAGVSLSQPAPASQIESHLTIPPWAFAAAAVLALIPAAAILPKFSGDGVHLADPIFDHAKSAFVDAMARLGVPPVNPVFGEAGAPGRLAYYYLWHYSAAELALVARGSGWEADIGLTWFTAFAALCLMMGLAVWLSKRPGAALWTVALGAAGSLWVTLIFIFQVNDFTPVLQPPIGLSGWLFQAAWVPQHLMSACCVVAALLLVTRYVVRPNLTLVLAIALLIVAGFGSSTFVGGITFAFAAIIAAPLMFAAVEPAWRLRFVGGMALAALLVICLIAPFVRDQLAALAARDGGSPIIVNPYHVFGEFLPPTWRRLLDLPGFWLIILPVELPAAFVAGTIALTLALRAAMPRVEKLALAALACLAGAGLVVSWLLASTIGDNNDLGLRAIIPAVIVLIAVAAAVAAGLAGGLRRLAVAAAALVGLVLSLPDTARMIHDNVVGHDVPDGKIFAQTPELWTAVRRNAPRSARVANNPLFLADLTPWPGNMSWALLSDRSSCFAGRELAEAYAWLPAERREAIADQFDRVFGGTGTPQDIAAIATTYDCDVVVVVPQDKIWEDDPFLTSPDYRLVEQRVGRWRIYQRVQ